MIVVVEHKTTSEDVSVGSDYWRRLRMDAQVSNYFTGARALGHEPEACLYDVIKKPAIKPALLPVEDECGVRVVVNAAGQRVRTKDGKKWRETSSAADGYTLRTREESAEEYRVRLRAAIAAEPDRYYVRGMVTRLEEDEEDAARDVELTAKNIADAERSGRFPRNTDACISRGSTCEYFAACSRETTITDATRYRKKDRVHGELAGEPKQRLPLLTTSSMKTFRRCPRAYEYAYIHGIVGATTPEPLRFGTLFHTGLEVWWKTVDLDASLAAMAPLAVDDFERAKAEELMRGYHVRWADETIDVLAVEAEFRAPLSDTWELGGKIDAIASVGEKQ